MKFKCEIEKITTLKKGAKLVLAIPDEQTIKVLKDIYNFIDKPVDVEILVDEGEQRERLLQITDSQRKKIYATIRDIANYIGDSLENTKENLKIEFIQDSEYEMFSLSNCSSELAGDFIDFLINFSFENGIPMTEHPLKRIDDTERYLATCLKHNVCCICGQHGEVHHCTGSRIGMGRNRNKVSDKGKELISLCRTHHNEIHTVPEEEFFQKYHVKGIVYKK